jgi:hypothetical protein
MFGRAEQSGAGMVAVGAGASVAAAGGALVGAMVEVAAGAMVGTAVGAVVFAGWACAWVGATVATGAGWQAVRTMVIKTRLRTTMRVMRLLISLFSSYNFAIKFCMRTLLMIYLLTLCHKPDRLI